MNANSIHNTTTMYSEYKLVLYVYNTRENNPHPPLPVSKPVYIPFPEDGRAYADIRNKVGSVCFSINNGYEDGTHVVIATTSDYVINLVRLYVHDGYLGRNDVVIVYVDDKRKNVHEIKLDDNGSLEYYPEGFMSAYNDILMDLMLPRKG